MTVKEYLNLEVNSIDLYDCKVYIICTEEWLREITGKTELRYDELAEEFESRFYQSLEKMPEFGEYCKLIKWRDHNDILDFELRKVYYGGRWDVVAFFVDPPLR